MSAETDESKILAEADRQAICDYTATLLKGLERLAQEGGLPVLAHLLSLARFEATNCQ